MDRQKYWNCAIKHNYIPLSRDQDSKKGFKTVKVKYGPKTKSPMFI